MKKFRFDSVNIKIYLFAITLGLFFIIGCLFMFRPKTSTVEKRALTEYPEFTWETFLNGEYLSQVSTWYSDTYPLRESLISANKTMKGLYGIQSEQLVGGGPQVADEIPDRGGFVKVTKKRILSKIELEKTIEEAAEPEVPEQRTDIDEENLPDGTIKEKGETSGSIYVTKDAGYEMVYFNSDGADTFVATINAMYKKVKDKVNLYVMIVPTAAAAMLDQSVIEDMNASDQRKIIDYIYDGLYEDIREIDVLDELRHHNAEYIYFRTDHHWTSLGAYYGYICFCREKGIVPKFLDEYETYEIEGFKGTFCQQAPKLEKNPDTVTAYYPNGTNQMKMVERVGRPEIYWNIINNVNDYDPSDYYSTFAGGDSAFASVHNENITDGSSILVIKDSFANAFVPWLVDQYEYVYWIDVRYTDKTISQMVEEYGVKDVLVLLSVFNGTTTDKVDELEYIGQ